MGENQVVGKGIGDRPGGGDELCPDLGVRVIRVAKGIANDAHIAAARHALYAPWMIRERAGHVSVRDVEARDKGVSRVARMGHAEGVGGQDGDGLGAVHVEGVSGCAFPHAVLDAVGLEAQVQRDVLRLDQIHIAFGLFDNAHTERLTAAVGEHHDVRVLRGGDAKGLEAESAGRRVDTL